MSDERWVVLGLGHPRAAWFSDVARWSTSAAVPVDFVKCVSAGEARARLRTGRQYSALLAGRDITGLDRDLIDTVRDADACVVVVDPNEARNWTELGVAAVLSGDITRKSLVSALRAHATPVARICSVPADIAPSAESRSEGRLVAVTGPGGTGSSTIAMALAQEFGADDHGGGVLLADLALDAELGMLHDSGEVLPGVLELTDAHRGGRLSPAQVRSLSFVMPQRDYHLLLGLRRHRDWTAIRRRAFTAALESLLCSYSLVIADVDPDIEGEEATGSVDVEDRNTIARTTLERAHVVAAIGNPTAKGLHALTRTIRELHGGGVIAERIVPVLTRAPRSQRRRADATRALGGLLGSEDGLGAVGNPVFVAARNDVEDATRDALPLPRQLGRSLHAEVRRRLERLPEPAQEIAPVPHSPERVAAGSLGVWTEETA